MDIKEILLRCDFSEESARHMERLGRKLKQNNRSLTESELMYVAAAGENDIAGEAVDPAGACKYGVKLTKCEKCEYLRNSNGVWLCDYK